MAATWSFLAVLLFGLGLYDLATARRRRLRAMVERAGSGAAAPGADRRLQGWLKARILPRLPLVPGVGSMDELRQLLLWAGRPAGIGAEEFYFLQLVLAFSLALPLLGLHGWTAAALGFLLGLWLPRAWLRRRVSERTRILRRELPRFVHLLATCLEAGLGLTEAVRRVAAESPGLLAGEMLRAVHEMAAGKPAQRAWRDLTERHESPELKEVVSALQQSHRWGVSIAEQLRFTLRTMRERKQQQAQQKAHEASVRMRVPMVALILMPTIVIILGPAVLRLLRHFAGG
ncbi:type II secretion system F family protein [Symbiobacterium thermophilum]|jgi:tight adherence protein C|nr:type II secretion system F family protein [Symbiobacterium thermophilum]MBY6275746.1 hypothetical protein [Symbiobacterium thermophilum]